MSRRTDEPAPLYPWRSLILAVAATGLAACAVTTVQPVTVDEITVEPSRVEALVLDEVPLAALLRDEDGNPITGRPVQWSSLDRSVATVNGDGLMTVTGPGETFVTATVDGAVGVAQVTSQRGPEVRVASETVALSGAAGNDAPVRQTVRITNGGEGVLDGLSATVEGGGGGGWLSASLSRSRAPADLRITARAGALATGSYEGRVVVSGPRNNAAVSVSFVVEKDAPRVALSESRVEFRTNIGGKIPDKKDVRVTNGGSGALTGLETTISYQGRSGWLTAELSGSSAPSTLTLRAITNALPPGDHGATVRVNGRGSEATVQVVYKVRVPG